MRTFQWIKQTGIRRLNQNIGRGLLKRTNKGNAHFIFEMVKFNVGYLSYFCQSKIVHHSETLLRVRKDLSGETCPAHRTFPVHYLNLDHNSRAV